MNIIDLSLINQVPAQMVGSKAWNLGIMLKQNFPVPAGFVITSSVFKALLHAIDLDSRPAASDFEQKFMGASILPCIVADIQTSYLSLHKHNIYAVAVRSSSAMEDLSSASFAGQYETFLNVCTFEDLIVSVKRCWYSFFSPLVQVYASHQQVSLDSLYMGVLVQGMIDADVSGVIFSKNPVTNEQQEIIINSSYGLGEGIVSGLVTPDQFIVNKKTRGMMTELGSKELKVIPAKHGTQTVNTSTQEQETYCLMEQEIENLVKLTLEIEQHYSTPVDIEFAMKQGRCYVLQVRPITT
jgi:pyruvate, water dikinase